LAAKLSAPGKDVYASLMVAVETFDHFKETAGHPLALLEVVETKVMDTNMVRVDAETTRDHHSSHLGRIESLRTAVMHWSIRRYDARA
jgi:hypothetical protein